MGYQKNVQLIKRSFSTLFFVQRRIMKHLLIAFFIFNLLASAVVGQDKCQTIVNQQGVNTVEFVCTDLTNLFELEKARNNATSIEITDSRIAQIPG